MLPGRVRAAASHPGPSSRRGRLRPVRPGEQDTQVQRNESNCSQESHAGSAVDRVERRRAKRVANERDRGDRQAEGSHRLRGPRRATGRSSNGRLAPASMKRIVEFVAIRPGGRYGYWSTRSGNSSRSMPRSMLRIARRRWQNRRPEQTRQPRARDGVSAGRLPAFAATATATPRRKRLPCRDHDDGAPAGRARSALYRSPSWSRTSTRLPKETAAAAGEIRHTQEIA